MTAVRKASKTEIITFESREKEPTPFDVDIYRPERDVSNGRLLWHVPADDAERFAQHFHVQNFRIVRKHGV